MFISHMSLNFNFILLIGTFKVITVVFLATITFPRAQLSNVVVLLLKNRWFGETYMVGRTW